ncbi:hypothetical protein [Bythopirellula polymerisocia]|uniref:hypothetical protein n=1 Tax=Bythopirellula polymerisocia TaxID=2528003 RepID=UPI0011B5355B|nr:hypothetical protein [Bythopirellula polymerisocia]
MSRTDPPPSEREIHPWDDEPWDVFIPDEDQCDPLPEYGDFWTRDEDGEADLGLCQRRRKEPQICWH